MSNLPAITTSFSAPQLQVIKQSYARDTNDIEFNLFVEMCRSLNLNPIKGQISAQVYSKNDPKKRNMVVVTQIGGLRAIAARQGDYLPDDEAPLFTYSETAKDPAINPLGIESVSVKVYRVIRGEKHRIAGTVYWDEFAPIEEEWAEDESGKRRPSGKKKLKSNWLKMPRVMLAKCAEAQALRRGWPEDLSNVYSEEEMEQADIIEGTATEVLDQVAADNRMRKLGSPKHGYAIQWDIGEPLETVATGKLFDRVEAFARHADTTRFKLEHFRAVNAESFRRYWADAGNDALELKRMLDGHEQRLKEAEAGV
jgi:phage recombination protein Bet